MKYKDGRKVRRKVGQSRKSQSVYDNLGHPYDVVGKKVVFIGKKEKPYCLTKGKEYVIIKCTHDHKRYNWDESLRGKKKEKNVKTDQGEDYFIRIINDKGHKREYSHLMFKLAEIKILNLTLKKNWFDLIASGEKKEEFRDVKPYWTKRLTTDKGFLPKEFDEVHFRNGYNKKSPFMRVEWKGMKGRPIDKKDYYVIQLGKVLEVKR